MADIGQRTAKPVKVWMPATDFGSLQSGIYNQKWRAQPAHARSGTGKALRHDPQSSGRWFESGPARQGCASQIS